jgi:hypothetical protein
MPDQVPQPPPRQPRVPAAGPPQIPQIKLVVVLQVGLYRFRLFLEERGEALDSPIVIP